MAVSGDPKTWTYNLLREFCERHELKRSGKKSDLLDRSFLVNVLTIQLNSYKFYCCTCRRVITFQRTQPGPSNLEASPTTENQDQKHADSFPTTGWKKLVAGRLFSATFTIQTMLSYFLDTMAGDGKSSSNFKAISATDNSAMRLFQRGFVQNIQVATSNDIVYYKARCEPEMKSTSSYQIKLGVSVVGGDGEEAKNVTRVVYAECSCPAGKAPYASCKHLAAFLYAMEATKDERLHKHYRIVSVCLQYVCPLYGI